MVALMHVGLLTGFDPVRINYAAANGFGGIELLIDGNAGTVDPTTAETERFEQVQNYVECRGLQLAAIGCYSANPLHPDPAVAERSISYLSAALVMCHKMGVGVLATHTGRDPERSIEDNIAGYRDTFGELARRAADLGVTIAFENSVTFDGFPFRGTNIAFCASAWDMMFDAVPSDAIGLAYNPAHAVAMRADPILPLYQYADRIVHVHAGDAEPLADAVARDGVWRGGGFRYRIAGFGTVRWRQLISALLETGYRGNLHLAAARDQALGDSTDEQQLALALRYLTGLLP